MPGNTGLNLETFSTFSGFEEIPEKNIRHVDAVPETLHSANSNVNGLK